MLKSLFSGVSGLQSHQIAMDVESNNIANVNTVGFKYSRANFSDLLAQTQAIATAPQGSLGGKNPVQVGLGASASSITKIFAQGSVQNSDKNTDVAIQGDGFFIVSPDGGNTYKYTRSGDFKFDAGGNFVDNNGFIVQGWLRDRTTGLVDATAPITNINIPPGLTTPASPTQNVVVKANLNSGPLVKTFSPAYEVPAGPPPALPIPPALDKNGNAIESGDMGVLFNDSGEAFNLQTGQGIWASFVNSEVTSGGVVSAGVAELDITFELDDGTTKQITTSGGVIGNSADQNGARYVSAINAESSTTGISATYDTITDTITLTNSNSDSNSSHNIRINAVGGADDSGFLVGDSVTTAYRYQYDPTVATTVAGGDKKFTTIADLRYALETQANADGGGATSNVEVKVNEQGKFELSNPGGSANDYNINLSITGMDAGSIVGGGITENTKFTRNMEALNSTLPAGSTAMAFSQGF
ncbi:MAG: flagellar hook-basal body complex protein, partial [Sulfurimonas sp.]